jgi:phosphoadenosine phosphosulfate reductase
MLHLATQFFPKLRVIFIDTGYLFPETYRFAEELRERFDIELLVYTASMSAARQQALYGKRWEGDADDQREYLQQNKVEPLDRALAELNPKAWLAGLRRHQTEFRKHLRPVELHKGSYKVHPILSWTEETAADYMAQHDLPYHPLHAKGYRSIGDEHSTFPVLEGEDSRAGRMLGVHRECGIHLPRVELSHRSSSL